MKIPLLLTLALTGCILSSCATSLYHDGQEIAVFRSDATDLAYSRSPDGSVTLTASALSNSQPTTAAGQTLTPAIGAIGAMQALKHAPDVINAFTGNHLKP